MVRDNSKDYGKSAVKAIREYLQRNQTTWPKLNGECVALILQEHYESFISAQPELPFERQTDSLPELGATRRTRKESAERDPLFDRLALLTGSADLAQITKSENRTIGVALAEIKKATPDVTADEIERRILCYKRAHRDWQLTPTALAKHWSEFAISPETKAQKLDPYKTPDNWRNRFNATFPGIEPPADWSEISVPLRTDILRKTSQ
jgi:hypothetical protein